MSLYIAALIFPSTLTGLLSFCCQKTPLPSAAATTMLHCRDGIDQVRSGAWFLPDMMLNQWAKSFSLDYRTLFHMVYEIFRCLKVNFRLTVMCLLLRNGFCLASPSYRADWSNVSEIIVLLEGSPFSSKPSWSSDEWMNEWMSIWFLVTSLIKTFYLDYSNLFGGQLKWELWCFLDFFLLWMMEATVLTGTFGAAEFFLYRSPDLRLDIIVSPRSTDNSLLWHALSPMRPYLDRCVTFQMIFTQLNLPQVDLLPQVGLDELSYGKIYKVISGNRLHLCSVLTVMAKAVNTYWQNEEQVNYCKYFLEARYVFRHVWHNFKLGFCGCSNKMCLQTAYQAMHWFPLLAEVIIMVYHWGSSLVFVLLPHLAI